MFHVHLEKLQKRAFDLVSNAYTSIRAEDLARLMGVKTEVAVNGEYSMLGMVNLGPSKTMSLATFLVQFHGSCCLFSWLNVH